MSNETWDMPEPKHWQLGLPPGATATAAGSAGSTTGSGRSSSETSSSGATSSIYESDPLRRYAEPWHARMVAVLRVAMRERLLDALCDVVSQYLRPTVHELASEFVLIARRGLCLPSNSAMGSYVKWGAYCAAPTASSAPLSSRDPFEGCTLSQPEDKRLSPAAAWWRYNAAAVKMDRDCFNAFLMNALPYQLLGNSASASEQKAAAVRFLTPGRDDYDGQYMQQQLNAGCDRFQRACKRVDARLSELPSTQKQSQQPAPSLICTELHDAWVLAEWFLLELQTVIASANDEYVSPTPAALAVAASRGVANPSKNQQQKRKQEARAELLARDPGAEGPVASLRDTFLALANYLYDDVWTVYDPRAFVFAYITPGPCLNGEARPDLVIGWPHPDPKAFPSPLASPLPEPEPAPVSKTKTKKTAIVKKDKGPAPAIRHYMTFSEYPSWCYFD